MREVPSIPHMMQHVGFQIPVCAMEYLMPTKITPQYVSLFTMEPTKGTPKKLCWTMLLPKLLFFCARQT